MKIRKATIKDVRSINKLNKEFFHEFRNSSSRGFAERLQLQIQQMGLTKFFGHGSVRVERRSGMC